MASAHGCLWVTVRVGWAVRPRGDATVRPWLGQNKNIVVYFYISFFFKKEIYTISLQNSFLTLKLPLEVLNKIRGGGKNLGSVVIHEHNYLILFGLRDHGHSVVILHHLGAHPYPILTAVSYGFLIGIVREGRDWCVCVQT